MDKKELQKAQNIVDALFYDDKALTQWQHTLLENVISIAQTKLRQPDVIKSVCDVCNGDGIDDSSFYNPPCGRCKGTGKQTVL